MSDSAYSSPQTHPHQNMIATGSINNDLSIRIWVDRAISDGWYGIYNTAFWNEQSPLAKSWKGPISFDAMQWPENETKSPDFGDNCTPRRGNRQDERPLGKSLDRLCMYQVCRTWFSEAIYCGAGTWSSTLRDLLICICQSRIMRFQERIDLR